MFDSENFRIIAYFGGVVGVLAILFLICLLTPILRKNWGFIGTGLSLIAISLIYFTQDSWLKPWLDDEELFEISKTGTLIIGCLCWASVINLLVKFFIWNGVFSNASGESIIPKILRDFITLLIFFTTIALILHYVLDRSISAVVATSGLAALILGYSAQSTLAQVFSGLGNNLSKVFEKGDWIQINGETGKVIDTNWRFLTLETFYGNWLTIPNSTVSSADIKNFSQPLPYRGVILPVLIEGGASPERVKKILLKATEDADGVSSEQKSQVAIAQFQDNGILYEIWYYTTEPDEWEVNDRILSGIWYALRREGIATSLSDVAIREMPTADKTPPPISSLKCILKSSEIFSVLTESEMEDLVRKAKRWDVGWPEIMIAQGEASESLYMIETGKLDVVSREKIEHEVKLAALGPGDMFGEISLLTGDPSIANIQVRNEAVIYEISKEMLRPVFEKRPAIFDELGKLMAERLAHTETIKSERSLDVGNEDLDSVAARLTARVRSLFGMS